MPKGTNQKRKLMVLARFLQKHSDEEHPLTLGQLQEELERWNAPAERKSIYDDMEQLRQLGLDVQTRRGVGGGWFIGQRDFELAELKLLVDAVQSCKFITKPSLASWSLWPPSIRPGSSSARCMWTGASRP